MPKKPLPTTQKTPSYQAKANKKKRGGNQTTTKQTQTSSTNSQKNPLSPASCEMELTFCFVLENAVM